VADSEAYIAIQRRACRRVAGRSIVHTIHIGRHEERLAVHRVVVIVPSCHDGTGEMFDMEPEARSFGTVFSDESLVYLVNSRGLNKATLVVENLKSTGSFEECQS
jgi:hypothetical protein